MRSVLRVLFLLGPLAGCGGATPAVHGAHDARAEVVACATGEELSHEELVRRLLDARVIYVGESHDAAAHHEAQREVIARLHAEAPSLAIGMEMFQRPYQAPLDAYVAGTLDEAGMLAATEWSERWRLDVALYRPILELARRERLRIVALNARRELTRAIARDGEAALSDELRAELPRDMDRDDPEHRAMVREVLGETSEAHHPRPEPARGEPAQGEHPQHEHPQADDTLERMYLAQLVWDETMGSAVAQTLEAEGAPERIVVLAGRTHVWGGLGIPRRAARRGATPFVVVLPAARRELAELRERCDYIWLVAEPGEADKIFARP